MRASVHPAPTHALPAPPSGFRSARGRAAPRLLLSLGRRSQGRGSLRDDARRRGGGRSGSICRARRPALAGLLAVPATAALGAQRRSLPLRQPHPRAPFMADNVRRRRAAAAVACSQHHHHPQQQPPRPRRRGPARAFSDGAAAHANGVTVATSESPSTSRRSVGEAPGASDQAPAPPSSVPPRAARAAKLVDGEQLNVTRALVTVLRARWRRVVVAVVCLLLATTICLLQPVLSGCFFDVLLAESSRIGGFSFKQLIFLQMISFITEPFLTWMYVRSVLAIGEDLIATLRMQLHSIILSKPIAFFDANKVGVLSSLITVDLEEVRKLFVGNVERSRGLRSLCECSCILVVLVILSCRLGPVQAGLISMAAVSAALLTRSSAKFFARDARAVGALGATAAECFGAIRTVRAFSGEATEKERFREHVRDATGTGTKIAATKALLESCNRSAIYVSLFTLYGYGGYLVRTGVVPIGVFASFIGYTFVLTFALQGVVNTLADGRQVMAKLRRINHLLKADISDPALNGDHTSSTKAEAATPASSSSVRVGEENASQAAGDVAEGRKQVQVVDAHNGIDVRFENIHFAYPTRPDQEVIKGLDLTLPRGKMTALVGASGTGKSTLVHLLCRFYEPSMGNIAMNGVPAHDVEMENWMANIAVVNQDPVLFSTSIEENIGYGCVNCTDKEAKVEQAARDADALGFIEELSDGFHTNVGERGGLLSGGQRQRIAIARALLKDAPVVVLDEATSALDGVSETKVQSALTRLLQGRTSLVIAHRLSTVQRADQIAVMHEGQIQEKGTHQELIAKGGLYAQLVNSQRLSFG
mmetsp:Transcript_10580/g.38893  ORF Transcript_10580/g.38893 Transcript_10580/m.38893 type:complete len:820 (-) Transcript_10580:33-2492(-)